ncbi:MAG: hypothetical protein U0W24_07210 [Bacteroidales bacterium]
MKNEKFSEAYFKLSRKNRYHIQIRNRIAFECKVSTAIVYNWLTGQTSVPELAKPVIAKIMQIPVSELFEETILT